MNTREREVMDALLPARRYVVTNYVAATLCLDEADARKVARQCDRAWPKNAPHVAVQLVPAASESRWGVPDGYLIRWNDPTYRGKTTVSDRPCHPDDGTSTPLYAAPTPPAVASGEPPDFDFGRCMESAHALCPSAITGHRQRVRWMGDYIKAQLALARGAAAKGGRMSTVGLTKAQERALLQIRDNRPESVSYRMRTALSKLGLIYFTGLEPITSARGHAALAAPRMTKAELSMLEQCEKNALWPGEWTPRRGESVTLLRLYKKRWQSNGELTTAGRTALNNVRAAMGSPDWKEGL